MMNKSLAFLLLAIVNLNGLNAQEDHLPATITWSKEVRKTNNAFIHKTLNAGPWGVDILRIRESDILNGEQVFLERYDDRLQLKQSQEIDFRYNKKKRIFEDAINIGGELYLFTSFRDPEKKKIQLFYQRIGPDLVPSENLIKLGEIDTRNKYIKGNRSRAGNFELVLSRDSSKVLIYHQLVYVKDEPENFTVWVFDDQLQELWTKNITLPYDVEVFEIDEYRVDKDGNVYLLGIMDQNYDQLQRRDQATYKYTILAYFRNEPEAKKYQIELDDKFIKDLTFRVANDGHLICSGFYSDKGAISIKGAYFFRINVKTKEIYNANLKPLDVDFFTFYKTKKQKRRAERKEQKGNEQLAPKLYRVSLDELIIRKDGGRY